MLAEPQSGYDIKKAFNRSLRNFWNAELSQIYPQLKKMENDGLLTSRLVASPNGPARRLYRRTAKGRRQLTAWLTDGPVVGDERITYLAQTFFLAEITDEAAAIAFFEELRVHMEQRLIALTEIENEWRESDARYPDALPDEDFYPQLTLALGLERMKTAIAWCDRSIARIRERATRARDKKRA